MCKRCPIEDMISEIMRKVKTVVNKQECIGSSVTTTPKKETWGPNLTVRMARRNQEKVVPLFTLDSRKPVAPGAVPFVKMRIALEPINPTQSL